MKNKYVENDDFTTIYIERLGKTYEAYIDNEDLPLVSQHNWYIKVGHNNYYAITRTGLMMHKLIRGHMHGLLVDHVDRNGLNNRRSNLRFTNQKGNSENSLPVIEKWYKKYIE